MPRVLSLSTYPIVKPVHGGQRRVNAFSEQLQAAGWEFHYASVYEDTHYPKASTTKNDIPLHYIGAEWRDLPLVGDLQSGVFAETAPNAYQHFLALFRRVAPDIIQLEHPFLWPVVRAIRAEGVCAGTPVIYSSHNWEAPLKYEMLLKSHVAEPKARKVRDHIVALEQELVTASAAVVAVSEADAEQYRRIAPEKPVFVVPNGVSRPVEPQPGDQALVEIYGGEKYLFYVGSAYPPNIDGFLNLVLKKGLFFRPPVKSLAICGGVSHGLFTDQRYQALLHANSRRVHFFPDVTDHGLEALKRGSHAVLLPIQFGGGSNLKTAEALASGKWVVATSVAMRGFSKFVDQPGVIIADTPEAFRTAIIEVMAKPPLKLTKAAAKLRETVYWDRGFETSGYLDFIQRHAPQA